VREAQANATKADRDLERMKQLIAKDEISQQQYDALSVLLKPRVPPSIRPRQERCRPNMKWRQPGRKRCNPRPSAAGPGRTQAAKPASGANYDTKAANRPKPAFGLRKQRSISALEFGLHHYQGAGSGTVISCSACSAPAGPNRRRHARLQQH